MRQLGPSIKDFSNIDAGGKTRTVVVEFAPGDRGSRLVASDGGGVVEVLDQALDAALDGTLLGDLAELALRVEDGFGAPVDIEAAAARGRWFLLQARPITTD